MGNKKLILTLALLGVYLLSAGTAYTLFSNSSESEDTPVATETTVKGNDYDALEFGGPRTEECPLNGAKYSKEQRKWWENHRPLGIMIENHEESRPQSGISFADVMYEAIAEGGITRFMGVYHCQDAGIVGPVRSARTYFLDFISEYGSYPLYAHVGGANTPGPANALGQIEDYGWGGYNDLNQFSIGFPTFKRDESRLGHSVATEHTMYSTTSRLWKVAKQRDLTEVDADGNKWDEEFVSYQFKEDIKESARPASQLITVDFWSNQPNYRVAWKYDKTSNRYLRSNGGEPHMDNNTDKQVMAKNVVVLFMQESRANDGYEGNLHMLYGTEGKGKALVFMDGEQIIATWRKDGREARTELIDSRGKKIQLNRGLIWFHIIPTDGDVSVD